MIYIITTSDISHIYVCIISDIYLLSSYHNIFGFSQAFEPNISRALQRALWTTLSTLSRTAGIFQRYDIDYVFTVYLSVLFRT